MDDLVIMCDVYDYNESIVKINNRCLLIVMAASVFDDIK